MAPSLFKLLLAGISFSSWLAGASPINVTELDKRASGYQNAAYFTNWYVYHPTGPDLGEENTNHMIGASMAATTSRLSFRLRS